MLTWNTGSVRICPVLYFRGKALSVMLYSLCRCPSSVGQFPFCVIWFLKEVDAKMESDVQEIWGGGEMPVKHKGGRSEVVRRDLVSAVGLTPVKGE